MFEVGKLVSFEHRINFTRVQDISIHLVQLYNIGEDLWIKTSYTLVKLMLCSKLTNLPPSS